MPRTVTKKNSVRIDFTGVEVASVIPEGEYIVEIVKSSLEDGDNGQYISHEMKIVDGKQQNKKLYNNTSLSPQSLWATKKFLEAAGLEIPDGEVDIDLSELAGCQLGVIVEHDTWKGRTRSRVVDTYPVDDDAAVAAEDPEAAPEKEFPTKEEIQEMGKVELRKLVAEHGLEVELEGTTAAQRRQVIKAIDDAGEPITAPAATKKLTKKKATIKAEHVNAMAVEDLAELIETYELDVDLDEHPILRRKRAAVIDALEAAELLLED